MSMPAAKKRVVAKPKLPARGTAIAVDIDRVDDEVTLTSVSMKQLDLCHREISQLSLKKADLGMVVFAGARLFGLVLEDARLDRCDLANVAIEQGRLVRVEFDGCKLTGAVINRSLVQDVRLIECRADYAEWQGMNAQRVDFVGCNLDHAYFNDADLTGVRFRDCDLRHVDFTNAQLAGADFRGSNLDSIVITVDQLRGVKVTTDQAIYLCGLIGLEIDDEVGLLD